MNEQIEVKYLAILLGLIISLATFVIEQKIIVNQN